MSVFRQCETAPLRPGYQSWKPALLLFRRAEGVNGIYSKRTLNRRQGTQARISPFQLLHDEAVGGIAQSGAAMLLYLRGIKTERTHPWNEVLWEFASPLAGHDL